MTSNQENQKPSCLAWFKLAELVSKKEKEKALNLYRLLSHSFQDKAYALQLEGDILWSLQDFLALEKYKQAAVLYKKEQRLVCAVGIYEHLLLLQPENYDFLSTLIILYSYCDWSEKFEENFNKVLGFLDQNLITQDHVLALTKKIVTDGTPLGKKDLFLKIFKNSLHARPVLLEKIEEFSLDAELNLDS